MGSLQQSRVTRLVKRADCPFIEARGQPAHFPCRGEDRRQERVDDRARPPPQLSRYAVRPRRFARGGVAEGLLHFRCRDRHDPSRCSRRIRDPDSMLSDCLEDRCYCRRLGGALG